MTQNKEHKNARRATIGPKPQGRIGHWVRVVVMFLSGGFIFPHALTEGEDIAKQDAYKNAKARKQ